MSAPAALRSRLGVADLLGCLLGGAFALLGGAFASGCVTMASPEISSMKDSIEADLGAADFDREFAMTLGRMSLGVGKLVLNRFDDTAEYRDLWQGIKKVEVGVYVADGARSRSSDDRDWRTRERREEEWAADWRGDREDRFDGGGPDHRRSGDDDLAFRLEEVMRDRGWTTAVAMREGRERTWVYYRTNPRQDRIRGVYVVALDGDELTLVRLSGRLDHTLKAAINLSRQYAAGEDPLL
jgi:hypothetical protein